MKTHPHICYVSLAVDNNTCWKKGKQKNICFFLAHAYVCKHTRFSHSALFLSSVKEHNTMAHVNHINRAEICQLDYSFNKHHNHCLIFLCQCETPKCQITIHGTIKINIVRSGWIYLSFSVMSSLQCLISYLLCVSIRFLSFWFVFPITTEMLWLYGTTHKATPKTCLDT